MTRPRHRRSRPLASSFLSLLWLSLGWLSLGWLSLGWLSLGWLAAAGPVLADSPIAVLTEEPATETAVQLEILNAKTPLPGVVSGGQVTPEELEYAAEQGYRTVINLRTEGEEIPFDEPALVEALGMRYIHLPVAGAEGITSENAKALHEALETAERPLILHCGSGNRVGALLALARHEIEGASPEEALEYGLESGLTRLEPVVREKLGLPVAGSDGN